MGSSPDRVGLAVSLPGVRGVGQSKTRIRPRRPFRGPAEPLRSGSAINVVISCALGVPVASQSAVAARGGNRRSNATVGEGPGVARPAGRGP